MLLSLRPPKGSNLSRRLIIHLQVGEVTLVAHAITIVTRRRGRGVLHEKRRHKLGNNPSSGNGHKDFQNRRAMSPLPDDPHCAGEYGINEVEAGMEDASNALQTWR